MRSLPVLSPRLPLTTLSAPLFVPLWERRTAEAGTQRGGAVFHFHDALPSLCMQAHMFGENEAEFGSDLAQLLLLVPPVSRHSSHSETL